MYLCVRGSVESCKDLCLFVDLPPGSVGNDGIDNTNQEARVEKVGLHLSTFSNGSSNNRGESTSKGKLEEPILKTNVVALKEESLVSGHGLAASFRVATISQGISNRPEAGSGKSNRIKC